MDHAGSGRPFRILVVGAYGQFGQRIASALSDDPGLHLLLAGRSADRASGLVDALRAQGARAGLSAIAVDVDSGGGPLAAVFAGHGVDLVIHAAGPFQQRDYGVARAALEAGAHYIDLSDARGFVAGIAALDADARARGRWVVSGASSVPGLSAAVVEAHLHRFLRLDSVESAISPGNRTPRGLATTRAILGYVGRPFAALIDGRWRTVHGWQSLRRLHAAGHRTRWVARCDVPDLAILPARYPQLRHCDFRAGLELRRMHFGLWLASWMVRAARLPGLARLAVPLLRVSASWMATGSDTGIMSVELRGSGLDGARTALRWQLVATDGSGPQVPATAAVVLARKLAGGNLPGAGARPCLDLFTLDEFMHALQAFPIHASLRRVP